MNSECGKETSVSAAQVKILYDSSIARLQEGPFSANEGNYFFAWFEDHDFSAELEVSP